MAKGLGAILAEGRMAAEKAAIEAGEVVVCPLCGKPMALELGGWFCRSVTITDAHGRPMAAPCLESESKHGMCRAFCDPEQDRYVDDWQCATIAAILDENGQMVVELGTVRGGGGRTNLRLFSDIPDIDLPRFIMGKEWTWMDWAWPFSVEAQRKTKDETCHIGR